MERLTAGDPEGGVDGLQQDSLAEPSSRSGDYPSPSHPLGSSLLRTSRQTGARAHMLEHARELV